MNRGDRWVFGTGLATDLVIMRRAFVLEAFRSAEVGTSRRISWPLVSGRSLSFATSASFGASVGSALTPVFRAVSHDSIACDGSG